MNMINKILIGLLFLCGSCNGPVGVVAERFPAPKPLFAAANVVRSKMCIYAQRIRGFEGDEYATILREFVCAHANSDEELQVIFCPNDPAEQLRTWTGPQILRQWDEFIAELNKGAGSPDPEAFFKGLESVADAARTSDRRLLIVAYDLPKDLFGRRLAWMQRISKSQPVDLLCAGKSTEGAPIGKLASGMAIWIRAGEVERSGK